MNNTKLLSAGSRIYAKKRKQKQETVDRIDFDFDARQEFLTGFHKRKLERKKKAREIAIERERVDRLEARAEAREERKRLADSNMTQMAALLKQQHKLETGDSDAEEDDDDVKFDSDEELEAIEPAAKLEPAVKEFATPTSLTTVTVIQDLELDDSYQSSTSNKRKADDDAAEEEDDGQESKTIPSKSKEKFAKKNATKTPKKKFRYETKAIRSTNQSKAKNAKSRRKDDFKKGGDAKRGSDSKRGGKGKRR